MNRTYNILSVSCITAVAVIALVGAAAVSTPLRAVEPAQAPPAKAISSAAIAGPPSHAGLWEDRGRISSLNLLYGPGGKEHKPAGKFTFLKEDMGGTSPKFDILDEQGVRWRAKLGEETKSETAATRLVWAAGYFADEDYYLPELRVHKMPKLRRGSQYVSADGVVRGVRLERKLKGEKKSENWSWFKNPFMSRILAQLISANPYFLIFFRKMNNFFHYF